MKYGIDVSKWQGDFDFKKATKEGVNFAILKAGGGDNGLYTDRLFENNYKKCNEIQLPVGCYFFGHAMTVLEAEKEANYFLSIIKGHKFPYPVYYDVEGDMSSLNKRLLTDIIKKFCSIVESSGYWVGIYASKSLFNNRVFDDELARYSHWVASWNKDLPVLSSGAEVQMWQYGGEVNPHRSNKIAGVVCDQDVCYKDYPTLIRNKGLNNLKNTQPINNKKSNEEIAIEVIKGLWGNGEVRKQKLRDAGYNYEDIQKIVNKKLGV